MWTRGFSYGRRAPSVDPTLPTVLARVYSASALLLRLALYAEEPDVELLRHAYALDPWIPLREWWGRTTSERRAVVGAQARDIERDLERLRVWAPEPLEHSGTVFGELYERLSDRYLECRDEAHVLRIAPGPLDERHPGFDLRYDARHGRFEARERRSPRLPMPASLAFTLSGPLRTELRFEQNALSGMVDAWELFALREILRALHEGTSDAVLELERELGRPGWDHLIEGLTRPAAARVARELAFSVTLLQGGCELTAFARTASPGKKPGAWKRTRFDTLLFEDAPLARDLAQVAMVSLRRADQAVLTFGAPNTHEALRLLARHPRVSFTLGRTPKVDKDPSADIVAGPLTMRLERAPNGAMSPRFLIEGREVPKHLLAGAGSTPFRAGAHGTYVFSALVPPALARWVDAAAHLGDQLSFPPEATPKLAAATQPLVAAGVAELPRDALGHELSSAPAPALRVEWQPHGAAVVEVFISVHPSAPLVAPGMGPELYTFEHEGQRVFVERDLARERVIADEAREAIAAPLTWDQAVGRTEGLEDALMLADFLDRNPLGLRIELTMGRAPVALSWDDAARGLAVRREGSWLVLDGALDVMGVKLTLGDVLDAARLARRYVKAKDGVFLELSKQAVDKLQPLAVATDLAPGDGESPRLHDAFAPVLSSAASLFRGTEGVDLEALAKRFEARAREVRAPRLDHGALRPYQREGVRWMLSLASWAPGCVLADDMGLGKTVQTAAVLKARARLGPQLIVAPASVSSNWMSELARFVPSLRARWFNDDRTALPSELGEGDVLVVSYGLLQREAKRFGETRWATVVVDEAQYVKNAAALRTDAVRSLDRQFTIALTGTPLENHLGELFSVVDLVFPGLLGVEATFRERFRKPIESASRDGTRLAVLGRLLSPFLLRRTRKSVLADLPPREEITELVDLSPKEAKRYLALRRACEQQFRKRKKGETTAQLKIALFAALTRLRQLACDVRLVDPSFEGPSSKIARVVELATELADEGNRALVFSQFTQFLDKIRSALEAAGLRVAMLTGETPTAKRRAVIDAFQAGDYDVFCVSLLAGGTGLNLTRASYVIHADPWWNPAAEEQATSRAHRLGQSEPVTVYRLVSRGTIEEAVLAMHATKRELAAAVLDGKEDAKAKAVTPSELLDLLRFGG